MTAKTPKVILEQVEPNHWKIWVDGESSFSAPLSECVRFLNLNGFNQETQS